MVNFISSVVIIIVQIIMVFYMYYNLEINSPLLNPFDINQDTLFHSTNCPDYCSGKL